MDLDRNDEMSRIRLLEKKVEELEALVRKQRELLSEEDLKAKGLK
jgi:hypothetical protein